MLSGDELNEGSPLLGCAYGTKWLLSSSICSHSGNIIPCWPCWLWRIFNRRGKLLCIFWSWVGERASHKRQALIHTEKFKEASRRKWQSADRRAKLIDFCSQNAPRLISPIYFNENYNIYNKHDKTDRASFQQKMSVLSPKLALHHGWARVWMPHS